MQWIGGFSLVKSCSSCFSSDFFFISVDYWAIWYWFLVTLCSRYSTKCQNFTEKFFEQYLINLFCLSVCLFDGIWWPWRPSCLRGLLSSTQALICTLTSQLWPLVQTSVGDLGYCCFYDPIWPQLGISAKFQASISYTHTNTQPHVHEHLCTLNRKLTSSIQPSSTPQCWLVFSLSVLKQCASALISSPLRLSHIFMMGFVYFWLILRGDWCRGQDQTTYRYAFILITIRMNNNDFGMWNGFIILDVFLKEKGKFTKEKATGL